MTRKTDWDDHRRRDRAKGTRAIRTPWQPPAKPINPKRPPAVFRTLVLKWPARCQICHERIEGGERAREVTAGDGRRGYLHVNHGV